MPPPARETLLSSADARKKEGERRDKEKEDKERRETAATAFKVKVHSAKSLVTLTFIEVNNAITRSVGKSQQLSVRAYVRVSLHSQSVCTGSRKH